MKASELQDGDVVQLTGDVWGSAEGSERVVHVDHHGPWFSQFNNEVQLDDSLCTFMFVRRHGHTPDPKSDAPAWDVDVTDIDVAPEEEDSDEDHLHHQLHTQRLLLKNARIVRDAKDVEILRLQREVDSWKSRAETAWARLSEFERHVISGAPEVLHAKGQALSLVGAWPGIESDEEITAALLEAEQALMEERETPPNKILYDELNLPLCVGSFRQATVDGVISTVRVETIHWDHFKALVLTGPLTGEVHTFDLSLHMKEAV